MSAARRHCNAALVQQEQFSILERPATNDRFVIARVPSRRWLPIGLGCGRCRQQNDVNINVDIQLAILLADTLAQ
jgi:hypothetical protein